MQIDFIFSLLILMFSVVAHEVAHGYAAYLQGDNTARFQGRLTLNPLKHLEWFGSIILPTMSYLLGGFIIGWAKPVPYNPYNLRNHRWGEAIVAFAGPLTNILIAIFFGIIIRLAVLGTIIVSVSFVQILSTIVFINLILAVFNLVPIPPLDGSKILFSIFPNSLMDFRRTLETYGTSILIFFVFFMWKFLIPVVAFSFRLITGVGI
ncbi:MAG: site-2 protease family protein [Minisyncoccota bacterium]